MPWATVHRIIAQLTKADFLRRDPETKRYEIGPALWFAGATYMANHRVLRAAMPYLQKAEQIEGIAVQLAERVGRSGGGDLFGAAICNRYRQGAVRLPLPAALRIKRRVLLAFETPEFVKQYLRRPLEG